MKLTKFLIGSLAASALFFTLTACKKSGTTAESEQAPSSSSMASDSHYPLEVCVVSGEKLGSMGAPHVINYEGTEVRFCCEKCLPEFNKDPAKFIAMLKKGTASSSHGTH